jgi:hypothetical protein
MPTCSRYPCRKGNFFYREANTMGFLVKCIPKQRRVVDGEVAPVLYVGVQELQDSTPERKRYELTATLDFEQARQITFESEERAARAVAGPTTHDAR